MAIRPKPNRKSLDRPISRLHHRVCSLLLALFFIWDIGFHLVAPLYATLEVASATTSIGEGSGGDPHPDCGFPDHQCALSHHHHFPALAVTAQFVILPVAANLQTVTPATAVDHRPQAARLIRGPPSLLNPLFS